MELYVRSIPEVEFELPGPGVSVTTASYSIDKGETYQTVPHGAPTDGVVKATLPYQDAEKSLFVKWSFTTVGSGAFEEVHQYNVVTPILSLRDVKAVIGDVSDAEATQAERGVRYIIQAHTGQVFGHFSGSKYVSGSGEPFLKLPQRLISLTSINNDTLINPAVALRGSGWYLVLRGGGVPSIRADYDGWHETPWSGGVPIMPPRIRQHYNFAEHKEFAIHGEWGYRSVPMPVQEAARLLLNDYACGDSMYRDRWIASMTAADWRIQFHNGAFVNTGNVRADQLLAPFIMPNGWVVI